MHNHTHTRNVISFAPWGLYFPLGGGDFFSYTYIYIRKKKKQHGQFSSLSPMYLAHQQTRGWEGYRDSMETCRGGNVRLPSGILRPNVAEAGAGGRKLWGKKENIIL